MITDDDFIVLEGSVSQPGRRVNIAGKAQVVISKLIFSLFYICILHRSKGKMKY